MRLFFEVSYNEDGVMKKAEATIWVESWKNYAELTEFI